jgi:DNA mismatch endonuclease (patch repair protein)
MSLIRSKNTGPERRMATILRKAGVRFRRHQKLPGTPDFVVAGRKVAVFVDGNFFHGRNFHELKPRLSTFWADKIRNNIRRDRRVCRILRNKGWSVVRVWEDKLDGAIPRIKRAIGEKT